MQNTPDGEAIQQALILKVLITPIHKKQKGQFQKDFEESSGLLGIINCYAQYLSSLGFFAVKKSRMCEFPLRIDGFPCGAFLRAPY